jgi:lipopolysaccharide export LptBFGC system permease protein LptF
MGCMKRIVYKYRISKFKRFAEGLLFAVLTVIALALCLAAISRNTTDTIIILPFCAAIVCMLMGLRSMFFNSEVPKEKI